MTTRPAARPVRGLAMLGVLVAIALAACGTTANSSPTPGASGTPGPSASPGSTPGPTATPGAALTTAELKMALIDRFGALWYCDPDFYPVAFADEQQRAIDRFGEVQADAEAFAAILDELGLHDGDAFTDAQKLAIYQAWKVLNAIGLDPIGSDRYRFDYLAMPASGAGDGTRTAGIVDVTGAIEIEQQAPAGEPMCPICLARGTPIETPDGPRPVEALRIGDPIWTLDTRGSRVRGTVIAIASTPSPIGHEVVQILLVDGRSVTASAGHPLPDGRHIGDLRPGDLVDGARVVAVEVQRYGDDETFDIAVSGPTGVYLAGGIPLASTLD